MEVSRSSNSLWRLYDTEVPHSRFWDPAYGVSPAEKLSLEHLQLLERAFDCPAAQHETQEYRHRNRGKGRGMTFEEFQEVLRSVIGPNIEDTWVERFFNEVDISCTGQIKWPQLCSYLLLEYTERQRASVPIAAVLDTPPLIRHCSHNKREPTVCLVAVSDPPPLRYVSVSKGGHITVWNSSLHILKTFRLAGDPTEEVASTRRFRGWATDAVYMENFHRVAIATDCRDLHFLNVSSTNVFEDLHLFGFSSIPTAVCYWHDAQRREEPPLLLLGDEKGGVHLVWLLNRSKGLFKNSSNKDNGPQRIFLLDLGEHSTNVSYHYIPDVHQSPINRIMFQANVIMTSSESDTASVVFMNVSMEQKPYIWKVKQGVKCFDYSASLQLLVTAGCDRTVRLWTRYVTSSPAATLPGHRATVLDVAIYQLVGQIFSYSRDAELKVWDISTHYCLKTIRLHFPCLQPGRIPEHGTFPLLLLCPPLPEETQPHLVVACKDYLAVLRLSGTRRGCGGWLADGEMSNPEATSLSCAVFNPTLREVATGHVDSSISLWDVTTGKRRLRVRNAHGEAELTCMTLDSSHRRLVTGARDGTIKVWSLLNGLNLHKLEPVTNSDVSGLTCLPGSKVLAVGRSQRIAQYDITHAEGVEVKADMSWKCRGVHGSHMLAVCPCAALGVVATSSCDGDVVVWRTDVQGPLLHLRRDTGSQTEASVEAQPVDVLLFLHHRAGNRRLRNRGVLVSSQGGRLSFWSVTGEGRAHGQFYAPDQRGQRVLSLSSDQAENAVLVSGSSSGCLQIWDISGYALDIKAAFHRPPVLQSWQAHEGPLACVEVVEVAEKLLIFTASVHGSAGLWTKHGINVGSFGRRVTWGLTTDNRGIDLRDEGEEITAAEVKGQVSDLCDRGQSSPHFSQASSPVAGGGERSRGTSAAWLSATRRSPLYVCGDVSQIGSSPPQHETSTAAISRGEPKNRGEHTTL